MKIRVLYFDGCPSYEPALATICEVIDEQNLEAEIEWVRVNSAEEAIAQRFLGSPTVQINGVDVEGLSASTGKPDFWMHQLYGVTIAPHFDEKRFTEELKSLRNKIEPKQKKEEKQ
jgi:hypothetical protein